MKNETKTLNYGYMTKVIIAILVAIGGVISLSLGDSFSIKTENTSINEISSYVIPYIYIILVFYLSKKYKLITDTFFQEGKNIKNFIKTSVVGFIGSITVILFSSLGGILPFIDKRPMTNYVEILVQIIILSILVGLFEESLFRGIIFRILLKNNSKNKVWSAFIISSILFGFTHFSNLSIASQRPIAITAQVVSAIFFGMLLSALYIRYKSFVGIVLIHGFIDFISFFPRLYGQLGDVADKSITDVSIIEGIVTVGVSIPLAIFAIIILRKFSKKLIKGYTV